jgi:transglutaminase-like putative cysteine protease
LLPSRYCQSDLLNELASSIVGHAPAGYQQVAAIEQRLRREMRYMSGSSNAKTSAVEAADSRIGVCRDYAHLGISLTRNLNIPARMAVGYLYQIPGLTRYEVAQRLREISENQERHVSGYYRMGHSRSVGSGNI